MSSHQPNHNCWLRIYELDFFFTTVQSNSCKVRQSTTDVDDACCVRQHGGLSKAETRITHYVQVIKIGLWISMLVLCEGK